MGETEPLRGDYCGRKSCTTVTSRTCRLSGSKTRIFTWMPRNRTGYGGEVISSLAPSTIPSAFVVAAVIFAGVIKSVNCRCRPEGIARKPDPTDS